MTERINSNSHNSLGNVLVVDDDPAITRIIDRHLEASFGNSICRFTANNAYEAQRIIQENLIDVVISDLELEGPDGFQLLHWLKQWEPLIQVIVITGHETQDALRSAFALGASDFHIKPIEYPALIASVEILLYRLQRLQPLLTKPTPDGALFGTTIPV